jgi:hypothetical protein
VRCQRSRILPGWRLVRPVWHLRDPLRLHQEVSLPSSKVKLLTVLSFQDPYLSLSPGNPAYIGDKSLVVHFPNKTRIGCANFRMQCTGQNSTASSHPTTGVIGKGTYNSSLPTGGSNTSGSTPTSPKGTGAPTSAPNAAATLGSVLNAAVWAMMFPIGVAAL